MQALFIMICLTKKEFQFTTDIKKSIETFKKAMYVILTSMINFN